MRPTRDGCSVLDKMDSTSDLDDEYLYVKRMIDRSDTMGASNAFVPNLHLHTRVHSPLAYLSFTRENAEEEKKRGEELYNIYLCTLCIFDLL